MHYISVLIAFFRLNYQSPRASTRILCPTPSGKRTLSNLSLSAYYLPLSSRRRSDRHSSFSTLPYKLQSGQALGLQHECGWLHQWPARIITTYTHHRPLAAHTSLLSRHHAPPPLTRITQLSLSVSSEQSSITPQRETCEYSTRYYFLKSNNHVQPVQHAKAFRRIQPERNA